VQADLVNALNIDKYRINGDVSYDYKSDVTGTRGLPVCA